MEEPNRGQSGGWEGAQGAAANSTHLEGGEVLQVRDVGAPLDVGPLRKDVGSVHGSAVLDQTLC